MQTYGIIPSRYGSSRFPGKPLAVIAGKPLVAWVVDAVKRAKGLDAVLVATDDERIVKAVEECGGTAVMTPSELPSGTDRIACAARAFLGGDFADDDILAIKSAADLAAKTVVKVVLDRDGGALYFSRSPIPCTRDGESDLASGLFVRHLGIYAYRGGFLKRYIAEPPCPLESTEKLEQLRALWMGAKIAVVETSDEGVGVDTPEDAVRVGKLLEARNA